MTQAQVTKLSKEIQTSKSKLEKFIKTIRDGSNLEPDAFKAILNDCLKQFENIKTKQETLQNIIDESELEDFIVEMTEYQTKMFCELSSLQRLIPIPDASETVSTVPTMQLKAPKLELPTFSDNKLCAFNYVNFKSAFTNTMNSLTGIDSATKFIYLRSQLKGRAFSLISNLNVSEDAYITAFNLLDGEFLNKNDIFVKTMSEFLNADPATNLETACNSVVNLRSTLTELQNLGFDLLETEASKQFVSLIFRTKLPNFFVREVARSSNNPHPDISDFFECYAQVKQLLQDNKFHDKAAKSTALKKVVHKSSTNSTDTRASNSRSDVRPQDDQKQKTCKFCNMNNHTSMNCRKYGNYNSRKKRASELGICTYCLSAKHKPENCSGKNDKLPFNCAKCRSYNHVTPLCNATNGLAASATFTEQ